MVVMALIFGIIALVSLTIASAISTGERRRTS
jgi:hypothetical protein